MGLSERDCEDLDVAFMGASWIEPTGHGTGEWAAYMDDAMERLRPVVEAIATRHVAATLAEAVDAIEAVNTPKYMGPKRDAYDDAARIVRAQIPPP